MELGDAGDALRAKAELAKRHARDLKNHAREQQARAVEQRLAEARAVEAARRALRLTEPLMYCARCGATWRSDAIREGTRRRAGCLLCGGPLSPLP
jgi:hypothetical protein